MSPPKEQLGLLMDMEKLNKMENVINSIRKATTVQIGLLIVSQKVYLLGQMEPKNKGNPSTEPDHLIGSFFAVEYGPLSYLILIIEIELGHC